MMIPCRHLSVGDKVMIRWTMRGTANRELFGISPSDMPTVITGKITEVWQQFTNGKWS
jgi:hypothetical protein